MTSREQLLAEADRLVAEAMTRAAAAVRTTLGPSPAERERVLLAEDRARASRDQPR